MVKSFIQQFDNHFYTISSLKFLFVSCNIWTSSDVILKVLQATKRIKLTHAAHRPAVQRACTVITITCWALWSQNEIPVYLDSWHFSGHPFLHLFLADNFIWSSVFSASHCVLVVVIFHLQRAKPQWWLILVKVPWASNVLSTFIGNKMIMLSLHWVTCYCTWVTVNCCISKLQYNCIIWNTALQYSSVLQYFRVTCVVITVL